MRFARVFAIGIVVLLLFLVNFVPVSAATKPHPCAQPAPPSVSGTQVTPPTTPGIVLINEVLNNPDSTWNCAEPAGTFALSTDSWVEVYNPQNQPFNLYAARAGLDGGPNTPTFHFPFGAAIAAHGYLIVFPDTYAGALNAGTNLRLTIGGTPIDQVSIPALAPDTSYARIPDGSSTWQITTSPTIDASNLSSTQTVSTPVPTKGSGYSGSGFSGGVSSTPTLVTGSQPGWTKLQLPTADTSATPLAIHPLVASPVSSIASSAWSTPRRLLLTGLVVALALALIWCWKAFTGH